MGDGGALVARDGAVAPGGRPPLHSKREIVNAILYLTRAGCAWRMMPKDLPPWRTVYGYFADWRDDGTLDLIHDTFREELRQKTKKARHEEEGGTQCRDHRFAVVAWGRHGRKGHSRLRRR